MIDVPSEARAGTVSNASIDVLFANTSVTVAMDVLVNVVTDVLPIIAVDILPGLDANVFGAIITALETVSLEE